MRANHTLPEDPQRATALPLQLAALGLVAAMATTIGWLTVPELGGLGAAIAWLGIIATPTILATAWIVGRLIDRRPDLRQPLGHVWAGLLQAMLIAFFGLVAVEIRTRYAGPMQHQVYVSDDQLIHLQRPHPELGWIGAPEYEVDQEFPGRTLRFATNSQGFRDIEQTPDPARPHLVIIGDSFPLGWGNELADSAGPILRAALPEFQVFNAAWQGWSKDQIAWSYQLLARPLTPRVVLMMFVVDPAIDGSLPLYLGLRKPYCLLRQGHLLREGIPVRSLAPVEDNIRYFRAWEAARVTDPLAALRLCLQEFPRRYTALGQRLLPDYDWAEVDRSGLEPIDAIEAAIMEQLAAAVQRDGARLIVVPAPRRSLFANAKDPGAAMVRHLDGYRRLGLETVDIMPALGDDWQACLNPEEHLNGEGMRRIRALLVQHVRAAPQGR